MLTTGTPSVDTVMAVLTAVNQRDDDALARVCRPDVEFCWPPPLPYGAQMFHFDPASVCAFLARASRAVPVRAMPVGEPFRPGRTG